MHGTTGEGEGGKGGDRGDNMLSAVSAAGTPPSNTVTNASSPSATSRASPSRSSNSNLATEDIALQVAHPPQRSSSFSSGGLAAEIRRVAAIEAGLVEVPVSTRLGSALAVDAALARSMGAGSVEATNTNKKPKKSRKRKLSKKAAKLQEKKTNEVKRKLQAQFSFGVHTGLEENQHSTVASTSSLAAAVASSSTSGRPEPLPAAGSDRPEGLPATSNSNGAINAAEPAMPVKLMKRYKSKSLLGRPQPPTFDRESTVAQKVVAVVKAKTLASRAKARVRRMSAPDLGGGALGGSAGGESSYSGSAERDENLVAAHKPSLFHGGQGVAVSTSAMPLWSHNSTRSGSVVSAAHARASSTNSATTRGGDTSRTSSQNPQLSTRSFGTSSKRSARPNALQSFNDDEIRKTSSDLYVYDSQGQLTDAQTAQNSSETGDCDWQTCCESCLLRSLCGCCCGDVDDGYPGERGGCREWLREHLDSTRFEAFCIFAVLVLLGILIAGEGMMQQREASGSVQLWGLEICQTIIVSFFAVEIALKAVAFGRPFVVVLGNIADASITWIAFICQVTVVLYGLTQTAL